MRFSYRGLTHSAVPQRGSEIILTAPPAAILAKRFPNKSDATKGNGRLLVVWLLKK
jgi:hypothetical protein